METKIDIKGIDLKTDNSIQSICETSNKTSSSTRSVLYVLLIISIMSFIGFKNTHTNNWIDTRIKHDYQIVKSLEGKLDAMEDNSTSIEYKNLKDSLEIRKTELSQLFLVKHSYFTTLTIPFLGISFDVNDLGVISGVSICIVLVILFFTQSRETNNLKIALHAISERYQDDSDKDLFSKEIEYFRNSYSEKNLVNGKKNDSKNEFEVEILKAINYTRRESHYNYLSMNELFNLPKLKLDNGMLRKSYTGRILMRVSWIPFVVYLLIYLNDVSTIHIGLDLNTFVTVFLLSFEILFLVVIGYFSNTCMNTKKRLVKLYDDFKDNHFKYDPKTSKLE